MKKLLVSCIMVLTICASTAFADYWSEWDNGNLYEIQGLTTGPSGTIEIFVNDLSLGILTAPGWGMGLYTSSPQGMGDTAGMPDYSLWETKIGSEAEWGSSIAGWAIYDTGGFKTLTMQYSTESPAIAPVPEPATMLLFGLGLLGLVGVSRKKK
jgi:PEP-CTERM motif